MKRLVLCVGALVGVVVLGWIAVVRAPRQADPAKPAGVATAPRAVADNSPPAAIVVPAAPGGGAMGNSAGRPSSSLFDVSSQTRLQGAVATKPPLPPPSPADSAATLPAAAFGAPAPGSSAGAATGPLVNPFTFGSHGPGSGSVAIVPAIATETVPTAGAGSLPPGGNVLRAGAQVPVTESPVPTIASVPRATAANVASAEHGPAILCSVPRLTAEADNSSGSRPGASPARLGESRGETSLAAVSPPGSGAGCSAGAAATSAALTGSSSVPTEASFGSVGQEPAPLAFDPAARPVRVARRDTDPQGPAGAGASEAGASTEGTGQPGKKELEGPQAPQLRIQKFAPSGVQVGKPAAFRVTVANVGAVLAHGVEVRDMVPKGSQLIATSPRASRSPDGDLVWDLGTLKPGDEVAVEMQIMPTAEGELGSVATVRFHADATARTLVTKPELVVKTVAPGKVLIGEEMNLIVNVSNPGSGVATGVVLEEHIPPSMKHPGGKELEYEIGSLKPGESRRVQLVLGAVRPGPAANVLIARGDGRLHAEDRVQWEVIAPRLDMTLDGPKHRYLERPATYVVSLSNQGTAPAKGVELVAYLPHGLKFLSANNSGRYEPASNAVYWHLEELPANDSDKVEMVTVPIEPGQQKIRLQGRAASNLNVEREHPISVEGIADVQFDVRTLNNPIEVGGQTTYEIHVGNQGSKAATNVALVVLVPQGMRPLSAEGPTRQIIEGNRVEFESLARLAPKSDTTYRVRVQGLQPGDLRVRVQLSTDEMQTPVTKEESTRVDRDE